MLPAYGSDPFQSCKCSPPKAATFCKLAKASSCERGRCASIKWLAAKERELLQPWDGFLQNGRAVCKVSPADG